VNPFERVVRVVDRWQQRHRIPAITFAVIKKFGDDRGGHLSAAITYYGFLAIFPLLLVFTTVLRIVLHNSPGLQHDLLNSALADFPVVGPQIRTSVHPLSGSGLSLTIGILAAVWGSLGVAQAAQQAMADIWNIPGRIRPSFIARLLRSLLVLLAIGFAVVVVTPLAAAGTFGHTSGALQAAVQGAGLAINIGLYIAAFRILTPASIPLRDLVVGAVIGGVGWSALQSGGGYLVARQLRHSTELYGTFAIVLGLLGFLFLAAQLSLYAAEINVVRTRRLWPRSIVQPPLTRADRDLLRDVAVAQERRSEQHVTVEFDAEQPRSQPG
jgi:Predicted membrane protein